MKQLAQYFEKDFSLFSRGSNHRTNYQPQIPNDLKSVTHVWLRVDRVLRSLESPYEGPYRVVNRNSKTFTLEMTTGKHVVVSIDRVKPAYLPVSPPTEPNPSFQPNFPVSEPNSDVIEDSNSVSDVDTSEQHQSEIFVDKSSQPSSIGNPLPDFSHSGRPKRHVKFRKHPDYIYYD